MKNFRIYFILESETFNPATVRNRYCDVDGCQDFWEAARMVESLGDEIVVVSWEERQ